MKITSMAMLTALLVSLGLILATSPRPARAEGLSAADKAFFDKHTADIVHLEPTRVEDAEFVRVFSLPVYHVKVVIQQGEGTSSTDMVLARSGDKLISVDRPGTDSDMPDFPKMLNPSFKMQNDDGAKELQKALDLLYPIIGSEDQKTEAFSHAGNQWTFIRGKFFDHHMGFIFETDASGKITSAKYSLKLP